jgi:hypothetical protein
MGKPILIWLVKCIFIILNLLTFKVYRVFYAADSAYEKGAFGDDDNQLQCPLEREKIQIYLQILQPLYRCCLSFQKSDSTIADIIPNVLKCINLLESLDLRPTYKLLCTKLVASLKDYFDYELNSPIHHAASLIKVSGLKNWVSKNWSEGLYKKSVNALPLVAKQFIFKSRFSNQKTNERTNETMNETTNEAINEQDQQSQADSESTSIDFLKTPPPVPTPPSGTGGGFFDDDDDLLDLQLEMEESQFDLDLKEEITKFLKIITTPGLNLFLIKMYCSAL